MPAPGRTEVVAFDTAPETIPVFIGYDHRQPVAFTALVHSIVSRASVPVSIRPLVLPTLPLARQGLTPFTYSRFLVPYLMGYQGWGLFLDIDTVLQADIADLWRLRDDRYAVMVSKNVMRFEWASVMLFNCARCTALTPGYVETADKLHTIGWAEPEEVGDLPPEWNHLVGYDPPNPGAKLLHYTQGVPAVPETRGGEYAAEWMREIKGAMATVPWTQLMGNSVHAKPVYERLSGAAR